jgi:hypothetical protein
MAHDRISSLTKYSYDKIALGRKNKLSEFLDSFFTMRAPSLLSDFHFLKRRVVWRSDRYLSRIKEPDISLLEVFGWKFCRKYLEFYDYEITEDSLSYLIYMESITSSMVFDLDIEEGTIKMSDRKGNPTEKGLSLVIQTVGLDGVREIKEKGYCRINEWMYPGMRVDGI